MAPHPALSAIGTERGCVVLDQPQHAASSRRLRTSHALRLVFDTAALRSNGSGALDRVTAVAGSSRNLSTVMNQPDLSSFRVLLVIAGWLCAQAGGLAL